MPFWLVAAFVYVYLVSFPDPPLLHVKEGLVYKVGILGCADSAVVGQLRNKTWQSCDMLCTWLDYGTSRQFIDTLCHMIFLNPAIWLGYSFFKQADSTQPRIPNLLYQTLFHVEQGRVWEQDDVGDLPNACMAFKSAFIIYTNEYL